MDFLQTIWDFISNLDRHVTDLAGKSPLLFYAVYAGSIFAETGLVVTSFLPSETLVFAAGVLAANGSEINPWLAAAIGFAATVGGDTFNMMIGRTLGRRWLLDREGKILGEKSVRWSERYFDRYGPRTVLLCRFLPLVRCAAPFLAGTGKMPIRTFLLFNGTGALLWAAGFMAAGYFFGQIPWVEQNMAIIFPAIGVLLAIPLGIQVWHHRKLEREEGREGEREGDGEDEPRAARASEA